MRAILGGLLFGIGLAIWLVSFKVIALGTNMVFVAVGVGIVIGVLIAFVAPPRRRLRGRRDRRAQRGQSKAPAPPATPTTPATGTTADDATS